MALPGKKEDNDLLSSSDEDLKIYCQPCDRDGPRIPSFGFCTDCKEHLCETCFKLHKKHTLSRHHYLLDKSNMPQIFLSSTGSEAEKLTTPCVNHKKEMIKFFCHDHKTLLCHVCITLDHLPSLCKVDYIPEISVGIINSTEYHGILNAIKDITIDCDRRFEDLKKQTEKSDRSLADALTDLRKFRKEINERLDILEKETEFVALNIQKQNSLTLLSFKTKCKDVKESLSTASETIQHLNKQREADRLFMHMKSAEQTMEEYKQTLTKLAANDIEQYKFKPSEELTSLLHKERSLGSLEIKHSKPPRPSKTPCRIKSRKSSNVGEICIKTLKDESVCFVTGMVLLSSDLLVIVDQGNNVIKMVDIKKKSVIDELSLDETPRDIASISNDELAVTMSEALQFLSVSTKTLTKRHTLNLHGHCVNVSCYQGKMVVSFSSPAKVQILDMNGIVLAMIHADNIFTGLGFVISCNSCIYVSDIRLNTVTKIDWQGKVICRYVSTGEARGITMSHDEDFFVCNWSNNLIQEVSGDCTEGKVAVKTNIEPYAVCWCAETSIMYISSCSLSNNKIDNFLHTFKLS